ncbi:MAG: hypothetical protein CVU51_02965 [Deltaproteobacteria bacterium HGW-Deltaproteobacteria-1]|jgi:DNA primase|nr:MAG: hypothetical protein CVU51_02965 [Deltaproteobacteria bacterium HGW-Deltaproteobacteria-1]
MIEEKPDIMPIVESVTNLKKVGRTHGGECAGPCPFCGGRDRFRVWPEQCRFWCRGCGASGDSIDFVMKLNHLSFKEALVYLGIRPGRPVPVDPVIQRRREIQRNYEKAITSIYYELCDLAQYLHRLRLQVKNNPGALTDAGAVLFAEQMGELSEVDYKLDVLLTGTFEDQILILKGMRRNEATTISRAA